MDNSQNSTQPLVSVLIVNYNYGRFISAAIESALSQTYRNIEIIVVDDGSKDNSREVIERYKDRVKAIFKPNGGQPSGMNVAFAASSGEIICLLDADDYFLPDKVAKVVDCYRNYPEASYVFHPVRRLGVNGDDHGIQEPMDGSRWLDYRRKANKFTAPPTSGLTLRRSGWNALVFVPEELRLLADNYIIFVIMALKRGYYLSEPLAVLRLHGANMFSLLSSRVPRLPADVKVAFAMRKYFPSLLRPADRLVSITLAECWRMKLNDPSTRIQLESYLCGSTGLSKFRIHVGAALRVAKFFVFGARNQPKCSSEHVVIPAHPGQSDGNSKLLRT